MLSRPNCPDEMGMNNRPTVDGRRFFLAKLKKTKALQVIEYLVTHYALIHNVEPVLLVLMPDGLHIGVNDHDGKRSRFLSCTNSMFVRYLNKVLERTGGMIKPGDPKTPVILDAASEMDALLEAALAPTIDITPSAFGWKGCIYTPADAGRWRTIDRPAGLNPKTFPQDSITYRVGKPKFQQDDDYDKIRRRFRRLVEAGEKAQAKKNRAAGKRYLGPNAPSLFNPNFLPKERLAQTNVQKPRFRGAPELVAAAIEQYRYFRRRYQECLLQLRAGVTGIIWPVGTNYHHNINGFAREAGGWLTAQLK